MPFLHTMIKYAADRGGLAGRVADVGLRAMKKKMCSGADSSAVPDAGVGAAGMRRVRRRAAHTGPLRRERCFPRELKKEEGVVLDASDGQFILRAAGGGEYVFRMDGAEDMVEGGVQAGQYVRIWYDGVFDGHQRPKCKAAAHRGRAGNAARLPFDGEHGRRRCNGVR